MFDFIRGLKGRALQRHDRATWMLFFRLSAGAVVLMVATTIFGNIAEDVATNDSIVLVDKKVAEWFYHHTTPTLTKIMLVITNMHGTLPVSIAVIALCAWLAWRCNWYWLLCVSLTVPGGILLNVGMKYAFQRSRPSFDNQLLTLTTYSLPSGHVAGATLLYGVVVALLLPQVRSWKARALLVWIALFIVFVVAITRMYLGVHYLTDVLAAFAESIAWLALCITGVHAYWERKVWIAPPLSQN